MKPVKNNQLWDGLWFKVYDQARSVCQLETLIRIEDRISNRISFRIKNPIRLQIGDSIDDAS